MGRVGGARRQGGKNQVVASNNWEKHFNVTIECYSVPVDRILTKDIDRLKKGLECRAVAVTILHIDRRVDSNQPKLLTLTSVLYTPVVQWFGIDVREQVPKFLPMNLWPGSYTMFGFYAPDESGPAYVTLTGKIGLEDIYLEEPLNNKKSLSADQWSQISRSLEKELTRLPTKSTSVEDHRSMVEETFIVEEKTHRASEDTGYMTTGQSPYSIRNAEHTSESDDETGKDKLAREKRLRIRRKDTPASNVHSQQVLFYKDNIAALRETPLIEESNDQPAADSSMMEQPGTKNEPSVDSDNTTLLPTSKEARNTTSTLTSSLRPLEMHQDSTDVHMNEELLGTEKSKTDLGNTEAPKSPNVSRKKKKSLANKLGDMPATSKSEVDEEPKFRRQSDLGSEADDECDSSVAESVKRSKEALIPEDGIVDKTSPSLSPSNSCQKSVGQDIAKDTDQTAQTKEKQDQLRTEQDNDQLKEGRENVAESRENSAFKRKTLSKDTGDGAKPDNDSNKDSVDSQSYDTDTKDLKQMESSETDIIHVNTQSDAVSVDRKTNQPKAHAIGAEIGKKDITSVTVITSVKPKVRAPITDRKSSLQRIKYSQMERGKDTSYDRYVTKNKSVSYKSKSSYISKRRAQSIDNKGEQVDIPPSEIVRPKEAFSDTN
ncbi:hypothetical protein ACF0H5_023375 [Mactra antiquata]